MPSFCSLSGARRRRRSGERRGRGWRWRPPLRHSCPESEQPGLLQLAPPVQREYHLAVLLRLHLHRRQGEDSGHHVGRRLQRVSLSAQVEGQGEVYNSERAPPIESTCHLQMYVIGKLPLRRFREKWIHLLSWQLLTTDISPITDCGVEKHR